MSVNDDFLAVLDEVQKMRKLGFGFVHADLDGPALSLV
ncbi:hypothetical protein SBA4_2970011 [Candidatus Sulfopaludibacter sp. SbA4]|nr:hypothetical protein SBA4_2970011 [Candidatus Sulfopaludibacter sp. SbA4]